MCVLVPTVSITKHVQIRVRDRMIYELLILAALFICICTFVIISDNMAKIRFSRIFIVKGWDAHMLKEKYEFNEQDFAQLQAEAAYLEREVDSLKAQLASAQELANNWNGMLCILKDQMSDFITAYVNGELDPKAALSVLNNYMAVPVEDYNPQCKDLKKKISDYMDEILNYLIHDVPDEFSIGSSYYNHIYTIANKIYKLTTGE